MVAMSTWGAISSVRPIPFLPFNASVFSTAAVLIRYKTMLVWRLVTSSSELAVEMSVLTYLYI